jgi:catechol 2,3-dioxygenase-like lactoylglutathione lyase family enzyme
LLRLQHVSIPIPPGGEARAREFSGGLLGMEERDVPPKLDPNRLIWFRAGGDLELHLYIEAEPPIDARHLCFVVDDDLDGLRAKLEAAGVETNDTTPIVGRPRWFCRDPFGNLLELTRFEPGAA